MPKYRSGDEWARSPGSPDRAPIHTKQFLKIVRAKSVRRYCSLSADVLVSKDVFERLERMIVEILDRGVDRCLFRKRKTLKAVDL